MELKLEHFNREHGGTVFHELALNRFASKAFGSRLTYILAKTNGELAGFCPCHSYRRKGLIYSYSNLSSFELPYGGWVFDPSLVSNSLLIKQMPVHFNERISLMTNLESGTGSQTTGFQHEKKQQTVIVKLGGKSNEAIFDSFKHSQKQKIRRAVKLGLSAREAHPEEFGQFWALSAELKQRTGMKIRDANFYQDVYRHYHALGRATCTVISHEGEDISGGLVLANSNYAFGWVAGRKTGIPNNLYQNELLIWSQIQWANNLGIKYLDLGAVDPEKLPHLMRIKLSFSQELAPYYYVNIRRFSCRLLSILRRRALGRNPLFASRMAEIQ